LVAKSKYLVLIQTLCNNIVKFLAQQSTVEMIVYICESIMPNLYLFQATTVL
jgi:hypothetical protein